MSVWRRKALEVFPEQARELTSREVDSTYAMWREVLFPLTQEAFWRDDRELLARIVDYAAWSVRQPAKDVWNAAAVSFYEDLFIIGKSHEWMERIAALTPEDVVMRWAWPLWKDGLAGLSDADLARLREKLSKSPALKDWLRGQGRKRDG